MKKGEFWKQNCQQQETEFASTGEKPEKIGRNTYQIEPTENVFASVI